MNKWEKMKTKLREYYPHESDSKLDEIVNELDLIANCADEQELERMSKSWNTYQTGRKTK